MLYSLRDWYLPKLTCFADEKLNDRRRKILEWLSPIDFKETHEGHLKKRFQSTGQWLLDNPNFIKWRDDKAHSKLLWCQGARKS